MIVFINMEEGWKWWMDPRTLEDHRQNLPHNKPVNEIEIDVETYREYQAIMKQAYVVQEALEHMYRHQVGLEPYEQSPYKEPQDDDNSSNNHGSRGTDNQQPSVLKGDTGDGGGAGKTDRIKFDRNDW